MGFCSCVQYNMVYVVLPVGPIVTHLCSYIHRPFVQPFTAAITKMIIVFSTCTSRWMLVKAFANVSTFTIQRTGCTRHVMSCHVMSCHVMSCHVMSCHVMSCHVRTYKLRSCMVSALWKRCQVVIGKVPAE